MSEQIEIQVRLFALARQLASCDQLTVRVPAAATVADVRRGIARACPALEGLVERMMIAVNSEYADDATPLTSNAEIACIPPVSGG